MDKCKCGNNIYGFGNECYSCSEKTRKQKLAENLKNNEETETSYEKEIICPWCGYSYEPDFEDEYCYNEGDFEEECPECEKVFTISTDVDITYSTERFDYGICTRCSKEDTALYSQMGTIKYENICKECKPIVEREKMDEYIKSFNKKENN